MKRDRLLPAVCEILYRDWDPIGVCGAGPKDEYDSYAPGLCTLLRAGADEYKITARLGELARVAMGLSHVDAERDRRVARKLRALANADSSGK